MQYFIGVINPMSQTKMYQKADRYILQLVTKNKTMLQFNHVLEHCPL